MKLSQFVYVLYRILPCSIPRFLSFCKYWSLNFPVFVLPTFRVTISLKQINFRAPGNAVITGRQAATTKHLHCHSLHTFIRSSYTQFTHYHSHYKMLHFLEQLSRHTTQHSFTLHTRCTSYTKKIALISLSPCDTLSLACQDAFFPPTFHTQARRYTPLPSLKYRHIQPLRHSIISPYFSIHSNIIPLISHCCSPIDY